MLSMVKLDELPPEGTQGQNTFSDEEDGIFLTQEEEQPAAQKAGVPYPHSLDLARDQALEHKPKEL